MRGFFAIDGPLFVGLTKIFDIVWLTILWAVCCIPLVTIGASSSALYYTANKVIVHGNGYVFPEFTSALKQNFVQSTIIWLLYVLLTAFGVLDLFLLKMVGSFAAFAVQCVIVVVILCLTAVMIYALAYVARFELSTRGIIKNSAWLAFRHLPTSVAVLVIFIAGIYWSNINYLLLLFVPALVTIINSLLLEKIFASIMSEADVAAEELKNHPEQRPYTEIQDDHLD